MASVSKLIVLGNGPSLKGFDLSSLREVATLGMNAAYRYWQRIGWFPTIYSCLDDQVVVSHQEAIREMIDARRCKIFLLHSNILERYPGLANVNGVFFISSFLGGEFHTRMRDQHGLPHFPSDLFKSKYPSKLTTGSYSVRFGAYLGYTDILLMGIDCRYQEIIPEARSVGDIRLQIERTPTTNANYFFDDYQQAGDMYNVPNPKVHQGNLHLQSFQAIREDFEERRFNVTVRVGSTNTELFDQSVFEFVEPKTFLEHDLGAIFMPVTSSEVTKIPQIFQAWSGFEQRPSVREDRAVDLCISINGSFESEDREAIVSAFEAMNGRVRCFRSLRLFESHLHGISDLYLRGAVDEVGPEGPSAGPNNQFFDIVMRFSQGYSNIFLMEVDCVPIRIGWLDHLSDTSRSLGEFWIYGTGYDGAGSIKAFFHINGNAIYHVGGAGFRRFVAEELLPHFYDKGFAGKHISYDTAIYDYFADVFAHRASPQLARTWQVALHRLRFGDSIVNLSLKEDREELRRAPLRELRERFPHAFLVHGIKPGGTA